MLAYCSTYAEVRGLLMELVLLFQLVGEIELQLSGSVANLASLALWIFKF